MSDEGVHEIQLSGKQLVFMFMAATVTAVVIFLCGVMVGRGVNTTRASAASLTAAPASDPTSAVSRPASSDTTSPSEPVSSQESLKGLTYARRLEAPEPPPEPAVEPVTAPPPAPAGAASKANRPPAVQPAANPVSSEEPKGDGFVVQVASLRSRDDADAIARRLSAKGFPSFVTTPASSGPRVFRVRVGKYPERSEAETIARRLEKEEQFKPWITR